MVHDDDAAAVGVTGETCCAAVPADPGWILCGAPATAVHRYACVHEHIKERATCAEHEPAEGRVGCIQCWKAGHDCPLVFVPVMA